MKSYKITYYRIRIRIRIRNDLSCYKRSSPFKQLGPEVSPQCSEFDSQSFIFFQQNIHIFEYMSSTCYFSSLRIIDVLGKQQEEKTYILTGFHHLFDLCVRDNAWPHGYAINLKVICRFEVTG